MIKVEQPSKDSIRLTSEDRYGNPLVKTFRVGDLVEYDSYNLSYLGRIVSIGAKTVTIQPRYESKKRRLSKDEFARRNRNFNLDEILKMNSDTMQTI